VITSQAVQNIGDMDGNSKTYIICPPMVDFPASAITTRRFITPQVYSHFT